MGFSKSPALPELEFFPMHMGEIDAVAALEARCQAFPWTRRNFSDAIEACYSTWVARQGGLLIGFAVFMMVLDEAHLLNIGIDPKVQRQGNGARLLRHIERCAGFFGAKQIFLEVREGNEKAIALYRQLGFAEIGRREKYYPAKTGRENALVFSRRLVIEDGEKK